MNHDRSHTSIRGASGRALTEAYDYKLRISLLSGVGSRATLLQVDSETLPDFLESASENTQTLFATMRDAGAFQEPWPNARC